MLCTIWGLLFSVTNCKGQSGWNFSGHRIWARGRCSCSADVDQLWLRPDVCWCDSAGVDRCHQFRLLSVFSRRWLTGEFNFIWWSRLGYVCVTRMDGVCAVIWCVSGVGALCGGPGKARCCQSHDHPRADHENAHVLPLHTVALMFGP